MLPFLMISQLEFKGGGIPLSSLCRNASAWTDCQCESFLGPQHEHSSALFDAGIDTVHRKNNCTCIAPHVPWKDDTVYSEYRTTGKLMLHIVTPPPPPPYISSTYPHKCHTFGVLYV